MARKKRIWFPGAIYHIMARGNYRQNIFRDKEDYEVFLTIMNDTFEEFGYQVHAYCLMTNHYHILLESSEKQIWIIMRRMNTLYAIYYNTKYGLIGHLFQGRYKSCLVRDDKYFLESSRYIHLNPVKAGIVVHAEEYDWSGYRILIGMRNEDIVTVARTHHYFSSPANIAYRRFVEDMAMSNYKNKIRESMGENELWLPW